MENTIASKSTIAVPNLKIDTYSKKQKLIRNQRVHQKYYAKKSFTLQSFRREIRRFYRHRKRMIDTFSSKRLSHQFIERIMMAITAVNGCYYCSFVHSRMALESGCTQAELRDIMNFDFKGMCADEVVALTFAQHYAESNRHPSKEAIRRLIDFYGPQKSRDIYHIISGIFFGNLMGNTIDAFESRMRGIPPENGDSFFEFLIYIFGGFVFSKFTKWIDKRTKNKF